MKNVSYIPPLSFWIINTVEKCCSCHMRRGWFQGRPFTLFPPIKIVSLLSQKNTSFHYWVGLVNMSTVHLNHTRQLDRQVVVNSTSKSCGKRAQNKAHVTLSRPAEHPYARSVCCHLSHKTLQSVTMTDMLVVSREGRRTTPLTASRTSANYTEH